MIRRRLVSFAVLTVLVLTVIGLSAPQPTLALSVNAPARVELGCTFFTVLEGGSFTSDRDNTGLGAELFSLNVTDGAGTVLWSQSFGALPVGVTVTLAGPGTTFGYTATPKYNPITLSYNSPAGNGYESQHFAFDTGICDDLPFYASAAGCDQYVDIPSQAVGGQFVANAAVYWAPESDAGTTTVIEIGKTYLVAGQDATGQYRKVLVSCQWVWVQANTVGPNPEAPWNGAPLPTTVVQ
jgi:hypothetical protein